MLTSQKCPLDSSQPFTKSEQDQGLATTIKALNLPPCTTVAAGGGGLSLIPPGVIGGGASVSTGCEQINVMAQDVTALQKSLTCILQDTEAGNAFTSYNNQKVTINITGNVKLGNITIVQKITSGVKMVTQVSSQSKARISAVLSQFDKSFMKSIADSQNGYLSTPQGQKNFQSVKEQFSQESDQIQIDNAIANATAIVANKQEVVININGYDPITLLSAQSSAGDISIDQTVISQYQSAVIVQSYLDGRFSTSEGQTFIHGFSNAMKEKNKGISELLSGLVNAGLVLILLVVGAFVLFGGGAIQNVLKYIIPLTIVAAVVVAVIFGLKKPPNTLIIIIASIAAAGLIAFEVLSLRKTRTALSFYDF